MRRSTDSELCVQWRPGVATKTACLIQAVLVSAACAVVLQTIVNLFWGVSSGLLHIFFFGVSLPVCWWFRSHLFSSDRQAGGFECLGLWPDRVEAEQKGQVGVVPLRITGVGRYWGALSLKLEPLELKASRAIIKQRQSIEITVWQSALGKDKFRIFSLLALQHARGGA